MICDLMKTPSFTPVLAAVITLLAGASLQAQNLISNGDFSQGLTNWTVKTDSPNNKAEVTEEPGGKTGKALRISNLDEKGGISLIQKIPCQAGKTYELTFMSKTSSSQKGSPGYAMFQFLDAKGAWLNNPYAPTATGTPTPEERKLIKKDICNFAPPGQEWKESSLTAIAPPDATILNLVMRGGSAGVGTIDLSDVSLIQK